RGAAYVARNVLVWHDRRNEAAAATAYLRIANVKRRETTVAVIRAAIAYGAFAIAIVLSAAQLTGGLDKLTTLAGASFVIILAGFAIQRVLMDVIAGTMMFVERWYAVGDTIAIPTLELQGIVEDVSLRRTKLRTLDGETIQVSNSQIPAVRVLPEGLKELAIELFVSERQRSDALGASARPSADLESWSKRPLGLPREGADSLEVPLRFFEHGCMRALLQHDLAGVADAPDQGGGDRVRAHVVPAADDNGRAVDLTESVAHVPAAERARHRPLVRALHRPV